MKNLDGAATMDYVLDMLGQLARLARRADLHGLSARLETLVAAERTDAGLSLEATAKPASKE